MLIVISSFSVNGESCQGILIRTNHVRNCGSEDSIIKVLPNTSMTSTPNCDVISSVCAVNKKYNTGLVGVLTIYKNNLLILNMTHGICQMKKENEIIRGILLTQGITGCPKEEFFLTIHFPLQGSFCKENLKIFSFAKKLKLVRLIGSGKAFARNEIKHDTGTSCVESEFEIKI
ncbi:CLUMA_CG013830, isoform A [Clunio marinus]|uniref:CLUMA_CG013830, isoform A n=1 Tax=Clunio marinus TaxID=568069 RepID=A0A1J1ILD0_9DIPT|nr:CLUMA_CG013830, isoform A [Clunio marinus]